MKDQKQLEQSEYLDITKEEVKACKGYENISDELAQKIADGIRVYTEILYNCFKERRFDELKAKVISISPQENKKAA
jgi:hypothetical protein